MYDYDVTQYSKHKIHIMCVFFFSFQFFYWITCYSSYKNYINSLHGARFICNDVYKI